MTLRRSEQLRLPMHTNVGPGFPRLTVDSFFGGLLAGISNVSYVLDMAACDPWLVAQAQMVG